MGDFLAGYVHDICGRRNTIFIGFMVASVTAAAFPYVPSVWPWFLLLRIVMTLALSGPNNHPLIADYVKNRSRGLASAQTGLMAGMGVVSGMFLIFGSTQSLDYRESFGISGAICFTIAIALFFCIDDKQFERREDAHLNSSQKFVAKSRKAYSEIIRDVRLTTCYIGLMIIKMGQIIATVFLNLWISSFHDRTDAGLAEAKALSSSLAGSSMGLAVIMSIVFGYLADKWRISCLL